MTPPPVRTQRSAVTLRGTTVELEYRLDQNEVRRRQEVGLSAVTDLVALNTLLNLPVGLPVSLPDARAGMARIPRGCVDITFDDALTPIVTRLVVPVLTVVAIVVPAGTSGWWASTLARAGRFAPYCTRSVLVDDEPTLMQLSEASFYGIGVLLRTGPDRRTLLEPEPFTGGYCTPASWAFAEQAYAQLCQDPLQA